MTNPWTWLAVLLAGAVVAWAWKRAAAPAPIRLTSPAVARDVLRMLLTNGAKGATLRLQERLARQAFEEGLGLSFARDVVGYYDLVLLRNVPRLTGVDAE